MGPWSDAEVEAALGNLDSELRPTTNARLRDVDRLLRETASLLDCGLHYEARGSKPGDLWKGLEASLDARRTIENEDGTISIGSLGAEVTIERVPGQSARWLVCAEVGQNCNRRQCAEDPHVVFHEEGESGSAPDAADLAALITSHLVDRLRSYSRRELDYFVHT